MSCLLLFLLMIITTLTSLPPIHASSNINATTIKLDSNITASSNSTPWTSPSGDFSFGFLCPKNNNKTFIVAIVYPIVPFQSTAWFARTCPPVPAGSILALKPDGFVLLDSNKKQLCRVTGSKLSSKVSEAALSDSGNLILSNGYSTIWESFKNPTDTILPGQSIDINTQLVSKKSESDFSEGRFYARMTENGNFTLSTKPVPSNADFYYDYYTSPSSGGGSTRLSFDEKYNLYVGDRVVILHSNLTSLPGHYFRATLEFDGTFSLYYFAKDLFDWAAAGTLPENACLSMMGDKGSGACGFNNVCYLEKQRPTCNCTEGFSLVDESNVYGDCKSSLSRNCGGKEEEEYSMVEVKDVDWPLNDYEQIAPSTFGQCRMACNDDYFCEAAIYRSESCWKKRMPLSNGRLDRSLGATAFLKVRKGT